jgi:hypothetical protein
MARKLAVVVVLLCSTTLASAPTLAHLRGIDELRAWFNDNREHPRLILLVSPT